MGKTVKIYSDGSLLEYDRGNFDDWCVYHIDKYGKRKAPRDMEYFRDIKNLAKQYGTEKVYQDFVKVYDSVNRNNVRTSLENITNIAKTYENDFIKTDTLYTILFMGMLAEENKKNTKIGKRIKRLGIHKLLIEDEPVKTAANFMRGMKWREIDKMCKERGF